MANEGATTVGSIDAKVGMDLDQWRRDVAEVKASAAELGQVSPSITVDANTTRAQEQMAAVEAAAAAVGATATASAVEVDAAAGTVSVAEGRQQTAAEKAAVATEALGAAEKTAARAAVEEAAAEEVNANAITGTGNAASGASARVQLIIAAVVGVIALAGPLAAAAVGIGGAFAGMGAAGVLGVLGVVAAMKQGSEVGNAYKADLADLKRVLDTLSQTAAVRLLASFDQATRMILADLPELNGEVAGFADQLGRASTFGLQGIITAFHVLNPLFVEGGNLIVQIAQGFAQWTADGGLQKFADYAVTELPIVVQTLGALGAAVVHIVEAFAPIGNTVLGAITAVSNVINAIPTPVLTETAALAIGVVVAFKGWQTISPIVDKASASVKQMGTETATSKAGAIGFAGAIITASLAVDQFALSTMKAGSSGIRDLFGQTRSVQQWSDAVDKGNININHLDNLLAASSGFWNDLTRNIDMTGTSTQTLSANELPKLDQAMAKASPAKMTAAWAQLTAEAKKQGVSQDDLAAKFPITSAAIDAQKQSADGASKSLDATAQATKDVKDAEDDAKTATDKLSQALKNLGSVNLDADQANIQFQQSLADANAEIAKNGKGLDETTQSGRDNMSALDGIVSSTQQLLSAQSQQGASEQTLQGTMAASRQAFINAAEAAGDTADQANALADQYGLIPANVETAVKESGIEDAKTKAADLKLVLQALQGPWPVDVQVFEQGGGIIQAGGKASAKAYGGTIGLASGATVSGAGSAVNDLAGMYRLANGEEVTSNILGQASKYRPLLKMINADAPAGQIAGRAMQIAGAQAPAAVAAGGPAVVHNHYWNVQSNNGEQLYQDVMRKTNAKVGP